MESRADLGASFSSILYCYRALCYHVYGQFTYTLYSTCSDRLDRRARGLVGSRVDYARCTRLDRRETFPWQTTFASAASVCCQESTFVDRVSTDRGEILFADDEAIDHRYLRCIPATRCSIVYDDRDALSLSYLLEGNF